MNEEITPIQKPLSEFPPQEVKFYDEDGNIIEE